MPTIRQRRVQMNPPAQDMYTEEDRVYTEEDYAVREPEAELPDEWAAEEVYPAAGWTGETYLPDEAFLPDEEDAPEAGWDEELPPEQDNEYSQLFAGVFDDADDLDPLDEELLTEEEQAELRRSHWQLLSGLADFAGVIIGTAAILVLMTLLVSLINWLVNDMSQSFILLQKHL